MPVTLTHCPRNVHETVVGTNCSDWLCHSTCDCPLTNSQDSLIPCGRRTNDISQGDHSDHFSRSVYDRRPRDLMLFEYRDGGNERLGFAQRHGNCGHHIHSLQSLQSMRRSRHVLNSPCGITDQCAARTSGQQEAGECQPGKADGFTATRGVTRSLMVAAGEFGRHTGRFPGISNVFADKPKNDRLVPA